jgi:hypothetical protein
MFCSARILGEFEFVQGFLHPHVTLLPVNISPAHNSARLLTSLATLAAAGLLVATGRFFLGCFGAPSGLLAGLE